MKTIREESDEEQHEARMANAEQRYLSTMESIEREYRESQARLRRTYKLIVLAVWVIFGFPAVVSFLVLLLRTIRIK